MQKIFDSPTKQWEVSVAMSVIDNFPLFVFDIVFNFYLGFPNIHLKFIQTKI